MEIHFSDYISQNLNDETSINGTALGSTATNTDGNNFQTGITESLSSLHMIF